MADLKKMCLQAAHMLQGIHAGVPAPVLPVFLVQLGHEVGVVHDLRLGPL